MENDSYVFVDDGCELYPKCLECPLPRCVFEKKGGLRQRLKELRAIAIMEMVKEGSSKEEIADYFNLSVRSVERTIKSYS
jgi:DNA invertase Pin-like site-specific DNA recombinase